MQNYYQREEEVSFEWSRLALDLAAQWRKRQKTQSNRKNIERFARRFFFFFFAHADFLLLFPLTHPQSFPAEPGPRLGHAQPGASHTTQAQ